MTPFFLAEMLIHLVIKSTYVVFFRFSNQISRCAASIFPALTLLKQQHGRIDLCARGERERERETEVQYSTSTWWLAVQGV